MNLLRTHRGPAQAGALVLVVVLAGLLGGEEHRLMTQMLIFALMGVSLNLLLGYTGLPSLGHALFFGLGAYATGVVVRDLTENLLATLLAGVLVGTLVAAVTGLFALRTTGAYFIMITLAFGQLGVAVALQARSVTGGADGLTGVFRPILPGLGTALDDDRNYYWFVAVIVLALFGLTVRIVRSAFGATLRGIRENPERMSALGFNVWAHRYAVYVLSGALAGVAGVLNAYANGFVSTDMMGLTTSAEVLVIVVLGGAGTLSGPLVGAVVILGLEEITMSYSNRWQTVLGLVYVFTVFVARRGIVPALSSPRRRRPHPPDLDDDTPAGAVAPTAPAGAPS